MSGMIIVMEGLDGSGKATQTKLLQEALQQAGIPNRHVTFPDYDSESSALVKLYLGGALGSSPGDVNPYAAASFYAADRFVSYQRDWKQDYSSGSVILADRYVTSNMIYQLSKVEDDGKEAFLHWIEDFEYEKMGLPRPAVTIYLDMKPEISQRLMKERYQGDESKKDIHERNVAFLQECRASALYSAEKLQWQIVRCYEGDMPRTIEAIHQEILRIVTAALDQTEGSFT